MEERVENGRHACCPEVPPCVKEVDSKRNSHCFALFSAFLGFVYLWSRNVVKSLFFIRLNELGALIRDELWTESEAPEEKLLLNLPSQGQTEQSSVCATP